HDGGTQKHSHGVQIIGGPRHNVACTVLLVVAVIESRQMGKHVIAQVVLDLARNADHDPASQELKNAFRSCDGEQQERVNKEFVAGSGPVQIINGPLQYLRKINPDTVVAKDGQCAPEQRPAVLLEIRKEWPQVLEHEP